MDAITLITQDHKLVESLFTAALKLDDTRARDRSRIVEQLLEALEVHARLEETIFYPAVRDAANARKLTLESLEEHHIMKVLVHELANLDPKAENYAAKLKVLHDVVQHHLEEEECEMLPLAQEVFDTAKLDELGSIMAHERQQIEAHGAGFSVEVIREFPVEQPER